VDPVLYQHFLLGFIPHPAVYVIILRCSGLFSEAVPVLPGKPLFGYRFVAMGLVGDLLALSLVVGAPHVAPAAVGPVDA